MKDGYPEETSSMDVTFQNSRLGSRRVQEVLLSSDTL